MFAAAYKAHWELRIPRDEQALIARVEREVIPTWPDLKTCQLTPHEIEFTKLLCFEHKAAAVVTGLSTLLMFRLCRRSVGQYLSENLVQTPTSEYTSRIPKGLVGWIVDLFICNEIRGLADESNMAHFWREMATMPFKSAIGTPLPTLRQTCPPMMKVLMAHSKEYQENPPKSKELRGMIKFVQECDAYIPRHEKPPLCWWWDASWLGRVEPLQDDQRPRKSIKAWVNEIGDRKKN